MSSKIATPAESYLSPARAAKEIGIGHMSVRRLVSRGVIRAHRIPGLNRTYIPRSEVERIIREAGMHEGRPNAG